MTTVLVPLLELRLHLLVCFSAALGLSLVVASD